VLVAALSNLAYNFSEIIVSEERSGIGKSKVCLEYNSELLYNLPRVASTSRAKCQQIVKFGGCPPEAGVVYIKGSNL